MPQDVLEFVKSAPAYRHTIMVHVQRVERYESTWLMVAASRRRRCSTTLATPARFSLHISTNHRQRTNIPAGRQTRFAGGMNDGSAAKPRRSKNRSMRHCQRTHSVASRQPRVSASLDDRCSARRRRTTRISTISQSNSSSPVEGGGVEGAADDGVGGCTEEGVEDCADDESDIA